MDGLFLLQEAQGVDRLTMLTDDILLSILGRVDHAVAARTSVLSKRWRNLPWLLPELNLHVTDFLPAPCPDPIEEKHMGRAMASLTKSTSSLLGNRHSDRTITRLSLQLYMTGNRSRDIGLLVSDAIDREMVKELHLAIVDEKGPNDCENEDMLRRALRVDGFFGAYPSVLGCLTRLHLVNARFANPDLHHSLFDCGRQLQHLSIENCDTGDCSPEGRQLRDAFSKLRKLCIHGIYVEFDLFWTMNLLEAAPSIEIFDVEVFLLIPFRFLTATGY
ncbi:hypothetical protein ACQ4PT_019431 [Festuca glaucescens]